MNIMIMILVIKNECQTGMGSGWDPAQKLLKSWAVWVVFLRNFFLVNAQKPLKSCAVFESFFYKPLKNRSNRSLWSKIWWKIWTREKMKELI